MIGAGRIAQWSRALDTLAEDRDLVPSVHMVCLTMVCNSRPKDSNAVFWPLAITQTWWYAHRHSSLLHTPYIPQKTV